MSIEVQKDNIIIQFLSNPTVIGIFSSCAVSYSLFYVLNKKIKEQETQNKNSQQQNNQSQNYIQEQNKFKQQQLHQQLIEKDSLRYNHIKNQQIRIHKICITGGPCGGKTTGITYLSEKLKEMYNIPVFIIPEAATIMAKGGCMIRTNEYQTNGAVDFQYRLLTLQMNLEDNITETAKIMSIQNNFKEKYLDQQNFAQDIVMIFDRGLMDGRAYLEQIQWQTMLDQYNMNEVYLRDRRYDLVLHMVSAAHGAESFYNVSNNIARYENDIIEAIECDKKTQLAWIGHPNFKIIENRENQSFQQKLDFLLYNVKIQIGISEVEDSSYKQISRKFIVDANFYHNNIRDKDIRVQTYVLQDTYLLDYFAQDQSKDQGLVRHRIKIRKRGNHKTINNNYSYIYSSKQQRGDQLISKRKNIISANDYNSYLINTDERRKSIIIKRTTFMQIINHQKFKYFFLDEYKNLNLPLAVLKIKVNIQEKNDKLNVPEIFKIYKEITGNKAYSSHNIAKTDYYIVKEDKVFFQKQLDQNHKTLQSPGRRKQSIL